MVAIYVTDVIKRWQMGMNIREIDSATDILVYLVKNMGNQNSRQNRPTPTRLNVLKISSFTV